MGRRTGVTFTDPAGEPSLLEAVARIEHHRLASLLLEAGRATDTPGVHDEITAQLCREVIGHLNAEAQVIHPEVLLALGDVEHRRLVDEAQMLERLVRGGDPIDLVQVDAAVADHAVTFDALLGRLTSAVGERRMAGLGFRFGPAAEAAPRQALMPPAEEPDRAESRG